VKKVMEHVYEKIVMADNNPNSNNTTSQVQIPPEELSQLAEQKIELYCNDMLLDHKMDLRTVRSFIWKGSNDLVLHYKVLK